MERFKKIRRGISGGEYLESSVGHPLTGFGRLPLRWRKQHQEKTQSGLSWATTSKGICRMQWQFLVEMMHFARSCRFCNYPPKDTS